MAQVIPSRKRIGFLHGFSHTLFMPGRGPHRLKFYFIVFIFTTQYLMNVESMLEISVPITQIPESLRVTQLFIEAKVLQSSEGSGFKFASAVKGAGHEGATAHSQRGDGKFSDGASFM